MGKIKEEDVFNQQNNGAESGAESGQKKEVPKEAKRSYKYTIVNKTGRNIDLVTTDEEAKEKGMKKVKLIKSLGRGKKEITITTKEECFIYGIERFKDKVTFVES